MNTKSKGFLIKASLLIMSFISSGLIQAQAAGSFDMDRRLLWYEQPWVWVAASCLFLLLLVLALQRGEKR